MHYIIGTDEAGYGPNLGPLLVSATLWQINDRPTDGNPPGDQMPIEQIHDRLSTAIVRERSELSPKRGQTPKSDPRVIIADSKAVYKKSGKRPLAELERSLLAMSHAVGITPGRWNNIWSAFGTNRPTSSWYDGFDCELPVDAEPCRIEQSSQRIQQAMYGTETGTEAGSNASVQLLTIQSRALFPAEFNRQLDHYGDNKSTLLSHTTLGLAAELVRLIDQRRDELGESGQACRITILCDKHGGRNKYRELLEHHFPDHMIEIRGESLAISRYQFGQKTRRFEARFQMKAEAFAPPALASLCSKYLRELAMKGFNDYWCKQVDDLKPTAGYPQDARRFIEQIEPLLEERNIDRDMIWRRK